jgi:hypothetical protein
MMNDEMEQLERRLNRQPLRQIPAEWRGEILAAASAAQTTCHPSPVTRHLQPSRPSSILHFLSSLLWPHPKAWAGLAAVWIFIFAVNFSMRDSSPRLAEKSAPPSPEVIVELRQQQRLFAELVGPRETRDADRPRIFTPKPRGERAELVAV